MPQNWGFFFPSVFGADLNNHVLHILQYIRCTYVNHEYVFLWKLFPGYVHAWIYIQFTVRNFFPNYLFSLGQPNLHAFFCKAKQYTVTTVQSSAELFEKYICQPFECSVSLKRIILYIVQHIYLLLLKRTLNLVLHPDILSEVRGGLKGYTSVCIFY